MSSGNGQIEITIGKRDPRTGKRLVQLHSHGRIVHHDSLDTDADFQRGKFADAAAYKLGENGQRPATNDEARSWNPVTGRHDRDLTKDEIDRLNRGEADPAWFKPAGTMRDRIAEALHNAVVEVRQSEQQDDAPIVQFPRITAAELATAKVNTAIEEACESAIAEAEGAVIPKTLRRQLAKAMKESPAAWDAALYQIALRQTGQSRGAET